MGVRFLFVALVSAAVPATAAAQLSSTVIAQQGGPAPGLSGVSYGGVTVPGMASAGPVSFQSTLTGSGVDGTNNEAVWTGPSGSVALTARKGGAAAGLTGLTYGSLTASSVNASGQVSFRSYGLGGANPGVDDEAVFAGSGVLQAVARKGTQVAGVSGSEVIYGTLSPPVLDGTGRVAFTSNNLTGTGVDFTNGAGLWQWTPTGGTALVVRRGDPVAGAPDGALYGVFGKPALNAGGQVAVRSFSLYSSTITNEGVFVGTPGNFATVARKGSAAAGLSGVNYGSVTDPALNAAGQVAFRSYNLTGTGVTAGTNDDALFAGTPGSLQVAARKGTAAAGLSGVNYGSFTTVVLNGGNQVAFRSYGLTGPGASTGVNDDAVWAGAAGSLQLVARKGSAAAGLSGVTYGDLSDPVINDSGKVAFQSSNLAGSGVGTGNNAGLWLGTPGSLQLIARKGDPLGTKTLADFNYTADGLTATGLSWQATFTDGTTAVLFTPTVAPVPEPAGVLAAAVIGLGLVRTVRRRRLARATA